MDIQEIKRTVSSLPAVGGSSIDASAEVQGDHIVNYPMSGNSSETDLEGNISSSVKDTKSLTDEQVSDVESFLQ